MKFFMTNREYRRSIEEAIQNSREQEDLWALKSKVEELQYKVQGLETRVNDLEQANWRKITITPTWSDKTVPIEKTDITVSKEG